MKTRLQNSTASKAFANKVRLTGIISLLLLLSFSLKADVIVTPATGGTLISADKAANASAPVFSPLGDIIISESAADDFVNTGGTAKTLIITAPAGWTFNTASGAVAATGADVSSVSLAVSSTEITLTIDVTAISSLDVITISGIEVQATDGAAIPSSGQLYVATANPGTATITGIITTSNTDGSSGTDFGSLSQQPGDAAVLVFTTEPSGAVVGNIFAQQPIVITEDQFGNPSTNGLGASKNVTITLSAGTGILSGTTILDIGTAAGNGTIAYTDLQINAAGVKKLMANASGLTFSVTNDFTVSQASTTTSLISDINPSCFSSSITLTATVNPAVATGTVQFFDGVTLLGTATITAGSATFSTSTLSTGSHSLTAVYSGDADYTTSTSSVLSQDVNPPAPATPGSISGSSPVCPSTGGLVYTIAPVANATTYNWTVPGGWTITAGAGTTSITVTSGTVAGNITVNAANSCGNSGTQTRAISLNPAIPVTPGVISGVAGACAGTTGLSFTIAPVANATTYTWTVPTGWSITAGAGTTSITVTAGSFGQNGDITVTAGNGCGTSTAQIKAVVVNPAAPATPGVISGPSPACPNTTGQVYSVTPVANATSYNWTIPAGWSITSGSGTNSITVTTGAAGGNFTVAAVNSCGSSDVAQVINIKPVAATNNTGWTDNNGPKTTDNISVQGGGAERRGYLKFPLSGIPTGSTITSSILRLTNNGSSASGATNTVNALGGNDPVSTAANTLYTACGSGANYNSGTWANTGQISLNLNATANTDIQGRIAAPGWIGMGLVRGGTATYNFFGYSSAANAPVLTVNYASIRSLTVTMNPPVPATPGTITGANAACSNTTGNAYSITAVPNATVYTWTVPAGWTITAGQGTVAITVTAGAAGDNGNITVTAGNSCGTSAVRTKAVTVTQVPTTSVAGSNQSVCMPANNVVLAANTPVVGTGAWSVVSGPNTSLAQFSSTTNPTATFTRAGGAGTYQLRWTITNGTCTSQSTVNIVFSNPPTAPNISFNQVADDNSETIITCGEIGPGGEHDIDLYNYTVPGGATFNWQYSTNAGPWTSAGLPANATEYPVASFSSIIGTHQFRVIMQSGGCTVTSDVVTLTVNPTSSIGSTSTTGCSGTAFTVTPSGFPSGTSYSWSAPVVTGGMTGGAAGSGNSISGTLTNNTATAQTATYTVTPVYGSTPPCTITFTVTVTVNPRPTVNATPSTQTRCSGSAIGTITITNPNSVPGTNFSWSRNNTGNLTGIANNGTGSTIAGTLTNNTGTQQTTNFTITATAGSCFSTTAVSVTVNPLPVANSGGNQVLCTSVTSTVIGGTPAASNGTGPYTYTWSPATGLSSASAANPTATPVAYPANYSLTVTDANGCNSAASAMTITQGAVTKTWNGDGVTGGTGDDNFNNPQNWLPKGVPSDCNDVVMNVDFSSFIFGTNSVIDFNNNVTIKSLTTNLTGDQFFNFTPTTFRLNVGTRTLNILNNTSLTTNCGGIPIANSITQISVATGGVVRYGGNLTTVGTASTNQVMPLYASTNNTGKFYLQGNANLGGIGNDASNKPAQVIFDGTGTQTVTQNSGSQVIYLSATSTEVGETNAPVVVLAGSGSGGFRNFGNLNVNTNATLDIAQQLINRNSAGGSINLAAGSTLKIGRNNGGVGTSNFPANYSTYNFNATSTVEYNAPIGQTVHHIPVYGNLLLSNADNKNPTGNITVVNDITITGAAIFIGGTRTISLGRNWTNYNQSGFNEQNSIVDFNGTTTQTINTTGGETFYQLRKTAASTLTQLSDVFVQGAGSSAYTLSAGTHDAGTFRLHSNTSPFNISAGLLKLARLNTILPEFDIATYNITGGTIELYGSGNQLLRGGRNYRNLTFSTSGTKTLNNATPSVTGTIQIKDAAIVDAQNYVFGGAGTNLTMTGTSVYRTAGTGIKPDALGTYSLGTGTTVDFTNNVAGTTEDIRLDLPTYYNLNVSGSNVANPTVATGVKMQSGGTFTVKNGGVFKIGNAAGFTGSLVTSIENTNSPSIVLEPNSTVEYYGGPAGTVAQTITNLIDYEGLTLSGTSVKTAPAGTLTVKGNFSNSNSAFSHNNGTLLLNGTVAQQYNSTGTSIQFYNFNVDNTVGVNVNGNLAIDKQLSLLTAGKLNLATGDITLKSGMAHTANVDKINTNDAITYGTGRFVVERFIATGVNPGEHAKSWQFLSVPLNTTQTVKEAWQEGAATPNANPVPGFGTQITSNLAGATTPALGFDVFTAPGPSMKTYNHVTHGWDGISSTTSLPITNQKGYMIFVRGDRSITAFNQPANATILRARGKLYIPSTLTVDAPPPTTVMPDKFEAVGNPYASAIDFSLVGKTGGVDEKYYVWDPLLTANYNGLGGYQTISQANGWKPIPGGTANYDANTPYQLIQSGQAFFVYSTNAGGTVTFTEASKVNAHNMVFRGNANNASGLANRQYFRLALHAGNANDAPLSDGNVVALDDDFSNDHDANDALKIMNTGENIGVVKSGNNYALETRKMVNSSDTVYYRMNNLRRQTYQFRFNPENMANAGLEAKLVDKFLNTTTPVALNGITSVDFTVTTDAASAAADRFYVVFKALRTVPVIITKLSASRNSDATIAVNWKADNEIGIEKYSIERSDNGRQFTSIADVLPKLNNGGNTDYQQIDQHPFTGNNFYRIKAISANGYIQFSNIVKVEPVKTPGTITVYPNPVADRIARIHFTNQAAGTYTVKIYNTSAQLVQQAQVKINSAAEIKTLSLGNQFPSGNYKMSITSADGKTTVLPVFIP
ncbi:MAG: PKD-like domain-containing protein [Ferruginibacter sp.]